MNQQPDKIFRDKLQGHQTPAPASAWEKISAVQRKKKHNAGWLKIAASFLLIAGSTYLLWPSKLVPNDDSGMMANQFSDDNSAATPRIDSTGIKKDTLTTREQSPKHLPAPAVKIRKKLHGTLPHNSPSVAVADLPVQRHEEVIVTESETITQDAVIVMNVSEHAINEKPNKSITLSYSAEETSKYLNKKELAEATSESRKPSTLKMLLQKAGDLKNNQDPLGDLRQMKNEILALNFKNEKQRGQNK